ncbi:MAG: MAPEG family protein [Candidatus Pelagadaptatus aseana]|uniref:MAPEG family protein n=1 Tax=Candidatus Pelagadaptatus aseana TaxID=3120508 RepID=UPI0039B24366
MQAEIFQPVLAMLLLTLVVWVVLFVRRMKYLMGNKVDAELVKTPEQVTALLPADVNAPGNNFKNLFEMPVIFYVVCLVAFQLQQVDGFLLNCAWGFVLLRAIHSLIHCTYNRVLHRFYSYIGSSVLVWAMLVDLALKNF